MILRRVMAHVKAQNWFAVAIDFVIVVVGVFIGIQFSNWNEARGERAQAHEDRQRLIADLKTRLVRANGRLVELVRMRRLAADGRVRRLAAQLDALSPLAVLGRGYAVCWDETRTRIIRSSRAVSPGDTVRVTLAEGELGCRVVDTNT